MTNTSSYPDPQPCNPEPQPESEKGVESLQDEESISVEIASIRRTNWAIASLWAVVVSVVVYAAWLGLVSLADNVGKIMAAVIAAVATIGAAIVTHSLTQIREQYSQQLKRKEENYSTIIQSIGTFIRGPSKSADDFHGIVLQAWVVGSPRVVACVQHFMNTRSADSLQSLLKAMRADLGHQALPPKLTIDEGIFGEVEPDGKLNRFGRALFKRGEG